MNSRPPAHLLSALPGGTPDGHGPWELGAPEPQMPPFDASKYAPMPEVELDPEDEFHVGTIA